MKIHYQYSQAKTLPLTGGDFITTASFLTALSRFAKVYYAGTRFKPECTNFGLVEYPGAVRMRDDCDLYFVRSNRKVFERIRKPKIWFAWPYDLACYRSATAIVTPSDAAALVLTQGKRNRTINPEGLKFPNAISLRQVIGTQFTPPLDVTEVSSLRKRVGGSFIVGHFGRLTSWSGRRRRYYPSLLFSVWSRVIEKLPGVRLVIGTGGKGAVKRLLPQMVVLPIPHERMAAHYAMCDLVVVSQHGKDWDILGNLKVKEPAACGVPVIVEKSDARVEELGENYPLFLPPGTLDEPLTKVDEQLLVSLIERVYLYQSFRQDVSRTVAQLMSRYSVGASAAWLEPILRSWCDENQTVQS